MPDLDQLPDVVRQRVLMRPVPINDDVPWTAPTAPVNASRLALVTTAGLHLRSDLPFAKYDQGYRVIPNSAGEADLLQSQSSIGFDRSLRMRDINVVYPIDRLQDLVADGRVGELSPNFYSLVGAQEDSEKTAATVGEALGPLLRADGVDLVLVTPTCPVCTHTGGAVARVLEALGVPTAAISMVREYTDKVRPPRSLYVPFPFGAPCGLPGDREQQLDVLTAALSLFDEPGPGPVVRGYAAEGVEGQRLSPVQASDVDLAPVEVDAATEVSMMRRYHELWVRREGRTAVGLTGIPAVRFRGVVRYLEAFVADEPEKGLRPDGVPVGEFLRYCADDLKALYLEGRMVMRAGESPDAAGEWLWGRTALAGLLVRVRDHMRASEDAAVRDAAFGIAR
ncbi:glycine/sarcosine/betaine reductase selenoprotein B family protein [Umezawaea sp. NPDC059074]|uniref:glycine/sarcosine/betaine reductase selenoprotein B family protein n=1 Tax=Umezawaea sp. NPDC059074 TaxID=3346716 RepID=UPI003692DFE1